MRARTVALKVLWEKLVALAAPVPERVDLALETGEPVNQKLGDAVRELQAVELEGAFDRVGVAKDIDGLRITQGTEYAKRSFRHDLAPYPHRRLRGLVHVDLGCFKSNLD